MRVEARFCQIRSHLVLLLLLLLLLMDKNCLAVQDCQARPQVFESAHILLFSINHQDSS